VSILVDIINSPGSLHHILKYFWEHKVDLTCIESRPSSLDSSAFKVYIDFKGDFNLPYLRINSLKVLNPILQLMFLD
jgi:prephenate dehydratase